MPVAVAAAIGFGTSLSGVAGGLSALANGPDTVSSTETTPTKLNRAVVALASRGDSDAADGGARGDGGGGSFPVGGGDTGGGSATGVGGSGGSGNDAPAISIPEVPDVELPGGGVRPATRSTASSTASATP